MSEHEHQFGHPFRVTKANTKRCAECHRLAQRERYRRNAAGPDWDGTWDNAARREARKATACSEGHAYVEGSYIWTTDKRGPWRRCTLCNRSDQREAYQRRMAEEQDYAVWHMLHNHNKRARRIGDPNRLTVEDTMWLWETYGTACLACGSPDDPTLDHVVPVSAGGLNVRDNLQPLCRACNASKGAKTVDHRGRLAS